MWLLELAGRRLSLDLLFPGSSLLFRSHSDFDSEQTICRLAVYAPPGIFHLITKSSRSLRWKSSENAILPAGMSSVPL